MVPAFEARKANGFPDQLEALSGAVEGGKGAEAVKAAYEAVVAAIAASEQAVDANQKSAAERVKLASELVRIAGDEYAIAVVDGKMKNAHEYQDALGFTQVAKMFVTQLDDEVPFKVSALSLLDEALGSMWPGLLPPQELSTNAGQLHAMAKKLRALQMETGER